MTIQNLSNLHIHEACFPGLNNVSVVIINNSISIITVNRQKKGQEYSKLLLIHNNMCSIVQRKRNTHKKIKTQHMFFLIIQYEMVLLVDCDVCISNDNCQ